MATKKTKNAKKTVKKVATESKKTKNLVVKKAQKSVNKTGINDLKKKKNNIVAIVAAVIVVAIIAVLVVVFSDKGTKNNIHSVNTINELNDTLNVKMNEPKDAEDINYGIENDDIARMSYKKKVSDGTMMNFVLKSSSATEENITGLKNTWGTKILMTVICDDESDIEVESFVATDNPKIMKSEWYDNDLYYSMTTDNLVTREDFLQEVNRVIIDNHIEFD